jgi:hypothetical protein
MDPQCKNKVPGHEQPQEKQKAEVFCHIYPAHY